MHFKNTSLELCRTSPLPEIMTGVLDQKPPQSAIINPGRTRGMSLREVTPELKWGMAGGKKGGENRRRPICVLAPEAGQAGT